MAEPRHIKYEFSEAITAKRNILLSQASLIKVIKRLQSYKLLRAQEIKKKQELRARLNDFATKINSLVKNLPKAKIPKIDEEEVELSLEDTSKRTNIEQELQDIQEKLARLQ